MHKLLMTYYLEELPEVIQAMWEFMSARADRMSANPDKDDGGCHQLYPKGPTCPNRECLWFLSWEL